jgi:type I restriction enzyme, S subunit
MMAVRLVRLKDVCAQVRKTVKPGEGSTLRYIGLETIEANTGQFLYGMLSKTPEVPKANSFRFSDQHVLYGKLRPYLNKVALPDFQGKCSTEIIPLLPSAELERAYLAYFLRSSRVVSQVTAKTAGSRMPRADMDFVLGIQIPLPPLAEQRRIVDILTRADGIIQLRREAQKKTAEIIPALFIDMFGDPATNPKGWEHKYLHNFA